jgi:thiol-disulfide isomerase/thioredoxin
MLTGEAGNALAGDFWSRDKYHATWTARRMRDDEPTPLPDPYTQVGLTNDEGRFHFSFPDLDGNQVSIEDPRFDGKVVLVDIFGSWCPNCNDSAPVLADLDRRYRSQGLEVVGLAFEMRDDAERNRELVRRFAQRHGVEFPLLLAGSSTDKALAGQTLTDLTSVLSYPTKIFIDRAGRVRSIHSGFAGPGTGAYYDKLVRELDSKVVELLAEPAA